MNEGHVVFSPISHSHHIADHLPDGVKTDSDWWMRQDLPLVEWADELHVVIIGEMGVDLIETLDGRTIRNSSMPVSIQKLYILIEHYE
jgi:hypothetical protein